MILNNKKFYLMLALCLLFSFKTFAIGGVVDKIQELIKRAAKASNPMIDKKFNEIMDEVLEITKMSRADIPEHILNNLRNTTRDPLRLIDPDSPYRIDTAMFFRPGYDDKITHLHGAFLQKSIDPQNRAQMDRLAVIVDGFVGRLNSRAQLMTLSRKDILSGLFIHRGITTVSGSPTPEFQIWLDDLYKALYEKETFEEAAKKAFQGDNFDKEAFFELWMNEDFRRFIAESHFMTKTRLTGNPELLIRWSEQLDHYVRGPRRQFPDFIESSLREVQNTYDVGKALERDAFWQTVVEASRESDHFAVRVRQIIRELTPVEGG